MKDIKYKSPDGKLLNVSLLGSFKVEELNKEFVMYSFVNDDASDQYGKVLFGEIVRDDKGVNVLGVSEDEIDVVLSYYNNLFNRLEGDN